VERWRRERVRCVVECVRVERVVWAVGAVGRARSEGRVRVLWVVETPWGLVSWLAFWGWGVVGRGGGGRAGWWGIG
jgi:hypothetical protein